jgi:mono/diheme cytochrome c family protein
MRKVLKWVGIGVGGLLAFVFIVACALFFRGRGRAAGAPDVAGKTVTVATDSAAVSRGRHLVEAVTPCAACHGPGLGGQQFPTPAMLVSMAAPNLTGGTGGVGATYTPADWDRAIRHGVAKDGRSVIIMPSEAYTHLTDADFASLIAYIKSVPAQDHTLPPRRVGFMGGILIGTGMFPLASRTIRHDSVGVRTAVPGATAYYGQYLVDIAGCRLCHGPQLQGMKAKGGPPPGPSLVASVATRSADDFRATLRTGRTPDGRALNAETMPWPSFARMTDDELQAIWLYVQSLK